MGRRYFEMAAKPVHPFTDGFPTNLDAALCQKILNISRTKRKTMICPNCAGNALSGVTEAL